MKPQDKTRNLSLILLLLAMLVLAPVAIAAAASISTDKQDYEPGDTVTYIGSGFTAAEAVDLSAKGSTNGTQISIYATADANGCISGSFDLPLMYEETYALTATGASSGSEVSASFSDTVTNLKIISPASPVTLNPGGTQVYTVRATTSAGVGVEKVPIKWDLTTGGTMLPDKNKTDTDGYASSTYTAGSVVGDYVVIAKHGNEENSDSQAVTIISPPSPDTTPPVTTIGLTGEQNIGYEPWYVSDVDVTLTATDSGSGVKEIYYKLNGGAETIVSGDVATFTITSEGTNTLDYWAVDNADNVEDTNTATIKIDKTAPTVKITAPAPGCYRTATLPGLAYTVTDNLPQDPNRVMDGWSTDEGEHTVTVTATDAAGNVGSALVTYTVDNTPPAVTATASPAANPAGWNNTDVTVTFTATDALSGVATIDPNVTVTTEGANQVVTGTATDKAGNVGMGSITLNIDKTPPTISASATNADGTAYTAGTWTNQTVTVHFTCNDGGSGVAACPEDQVYASETTDTVASGTCTDVAGNISVAASVTVKIDKTPPNPPTANVSPAPNLAGWNNSTPVTVTFTDNGDAGTVQSGVAGCTGPTTLTDETPGTLVNGTCTDVAGNISAPTTVTVKIDKTPPTVKATASPLPNDAGWNNSDVTVFFTATDALSGLAAVDPAVIIKTEGKGQVISGSAKDVAGNIGTASVTLNIDKTPPVITAGTPTGTPGENDWWISDVTVPFSATDNLSGFAPNGALSTTMVSKTTSGEGSALTVTSDGISDMAGNAATGVQSGPYKVDKTPPVVTITVPTEGAEYLLNQNVSANWSATDDLSGIASASGTVPSGSPIPTGTVGSKTFTVTAADNAGNTTSLMRTYYVRYNFIGFLPPVDNPPVINVAKAGRTFPIKWQLKDANGKFISDLAVVKYNPLRYRQTSSGSAIWYDLIPGDTSGASGLRYDSSSNQFIFTWQTSSTFVGKSYELLLELNDGSVYNALFKFTK
jgi:hypothetical protein